MEVNERTVSRLRQRCVEEGLDAALERKPGVREKTRVLDGDGEARLVALMCSEPPAGQSRSSRKKSRVVTLAWTVLIQKSVPGATPIRTERGWLSIYHGVFETMDGAVYRLGVALHDLVNPAKIIGISDEWVLAPEDPWEITGYVHNVVFTCGADTVMCVGTARLNDLVDLCLNNSRPPC